MDDQPIAEEVVVSSPYTRFEDVISPLSMKSPSPPAIEPYVPRELQDHLNRKKGSHWSPGGKELRQGKRGRKPNQRYEPKSESEPESESVPSSPPSAALPPEPPPVHPPVPSRRPNRRYKPKFES
jgi:hypothetical protein